MLIFAINRPPDNRRASKEQMQHAITRELGLTVVPDPHDVARPSTVQEVAVDGVGQVRPLLELSERRDELGPVRDEGGLVERAALRQTDERGNSGAYAFDRTCAAVELLDVDTRGQILRHRGLLLTDRGMQRDRLHCQPLDLGDLDGRR